MSLRVPLTSLVLLWLFPVLGVCAPEDGAPYGAVSGPGESEQPGVAAALVGRAWQRVELRLP